MYASTLWAMEQKLRRTNAVMSERIRALRRDFERALGPLASISASFLGPVLLWSAWLEERRLQRGHTYEPPTFVERLNWAPEQTGA
jgi:hypothetical protein